MLNSHLYDIFVDGVISLRQPHEEFPFLYYDARKLTPVDIKYMTMVKFHDDFIRYDFYHNCTDVQSFSDKHEPIDENEDDDEEMNMAALTDGNNNTDSYPRIWEYISKQFNEMKFDVLHIYHDSYQVYEKSISRAFEDSGEYDDQTNTDTKTPAKSADKTNEDGKSTAGGFSDIIKKGVVGVGSFLFIGITKLICSLDFVKNLLKEVEVDDDKVKNMSKKLGATVVNENTLAKFGFGDDDDE